MTPAPIVSPRLSPPGPDDHKYTRGKVVVIGGAMPGAAMLAALAAQRAGAGYVELLGDYPDASPHALVRRAYDRDALTDPRIGAVVVGPGLGRDDTARARLADAIGCGRALVLDADALTLLDLTDVPPTAVLTPHRGEFATLFGAVNGDDVSGVRSAAERAGAVVMLKRAESLAAHPDGRVAIAPPASHWLASAGTGDVLAGIVGAMLARGLEPFAAAQAALWLHGDAARRAGPGLIADDLLPALRDAAVACSA